MYEDFAKDIADGVINQKDISYAGLELMQKVYKVHSDIGVIERLYLKSPVKVYPSVFFVFPCFQFFSVNFITVLVSKF